MGKLLKVNVVDMDKDMRINAEREILAAFENYSREDIIANNLKKYFDKQYGPSWNIIVGKNFGSQVITQTKSYLFATYNNDEMSILIWKS